MPRNNRPEVLVHSNAVIRVFDIGIRAFGGKTMEHEDSFNVSREAWVAAVFLTGRSIFDSQSWYLGINPEQNSVIDSTGYSFLPVDEERTQKYVLDVQIFEHAQSIETLADGYNKKLIKHDLRNVSLVCYAKVSGKIRPADIMGKIKDNTSKVRDVWLIGNKPGFPRIKYVTQIFPTPGFQVEVNLDSNYQKGDPSFIIPYFGKRKGPIFEPLGKQILLKPNFEFEEM